VIPLQSQASQARTVSGAGLEIPFVPAANDVNNREAAAPLAAGDCCRIARVAILQAVHQEHHRHPVSPVILLAIGSLGSWVALLRVIGSRVRLWTPDLIKDTTIWFVGVAIVTLDASAMWATPLIRTT